MQSLVRLCPVRDAAGGRYAGWFEPAHFVQRAVAAAYARDYLYLAFSILTPDEIHKILKSGCKAEEAKLRQRR